MPRQRPLLIFMILVGVVGTVSGQTPEWRSGGRVSWSDTGTTSEGLGTTGSAIDLQSGFGAEFDATLMFSDRFGVEFSVGLSAPCLRLIDSSGVVDGGRLWLLPATVVAQYHRFIHGPWDPYVGLGLSWVAPLYDMPRDLRTAGVERLDFDGVAGLAAQIGANYQMGNRWYANVDLRYLGTSLDVRIRTEEADLPTVELDIDPVVLSLGFGYKF